MTGSSSASGAASSTSAEPKLDLSSLKSYSPAWPAELRFATALAVQYAALRCVDRVRALAVNTPGLGAADGGTGEAKDAPEDDIDGDDEEGTGERDEEGRLRGGPMGEWARARRERKKREYVEDWAEYANKFVRATCQHLGVQEEALPPSTATLEHVRDAARGRVPGNEGGYRIHAPEYEMGTSHVPDGREGTGVHGAELRAHEAAQSQSRLKADEAGESQEEAEMRMKRDVDDAASKVEELRLEEEREADVDSKRQGGPLTTEEGKGREIEVINDLLLVALGLGQYRATDGATTLFEQEAIFGDVPELSKPRMAEEPPVTPTDLEQKADDPKAATGGTRADGSSGRQPDLVEGLGQAGEKAWSTLRAGATSSWRGLASIGREIAPKAAGTAADASPQQPRPPSPESGRAKKKAATPTKPNEVCHYDARARALIFVAATAMGASGREVWLAEKAVAQAIYFILEDGREVSKKKGRNDPLAGVPRGASVDTKTGAVTGASDEDGGADDDSSKRSAWMNLASSTAVAREKTKANWGRWAATGAGFAIGGAIIGLTGGLAAPLVAPALVGLTGVSFLATTSGIVMMGTLLGLGGGGLAGYRVRRRLRGIDSFEFAEVRSSAGVSIPSLSATICCAGLLLQDDADQAGVFKPCFDALTDARDVYAIRCEEAMMRQAGEGLRGYVLDTLIASGGRKVGEEVLKHTALAGLAALSLPLTVWGAASAALDGCFVQAKTRAYKAGLILADTLKAEVQGHRPVTLVGVSLGCTTILTALQELARSPEENAHLVDSVFLVGAPVTPSPGAWRRARSMASRRFVVAYSSRDMVCGVAAWLGSGVSVEELRSAQLPRVAGSRAVLGVAGVENVDVTDLVASHFELNRAETLGRVLARCRALDG